MQLENNQLVPSQSHTPASPPPTYQTDPVYPISPTVQATAQTPTQAQVFQLASQLAGQFAGHIAAAERMWAQAEYENAILRDRAAQNVQAEDAYTTAKSGSGRTYTIDRYGRIIELMNREIVFAVHISFEGPFEMRDTFLALLEGCERPIIMSAAEFHSNSALLQAFQECPGIEIRHCKSVKHTAFLLRAAINQRIQTYRLPFYGGWKYAKRNADCYFEFRMFHGQTTHAVQGPMPLELSPVNPMPVATMFVATQRFKQAFQIDLARPQGWLLNTMFHLAVLTSLLQELGHPFPLAFCLLAETAPSQAWIRSWFSWFGDPPISLEAFPSKFKGDILARKDQPMVILDTCDGKNYAANADLLKSVLTSLQIPWKNGQKESCYQLQSLPVILSSTITAFTVYPDCITLEIPTLIRSAPGTDESAKDEYLMAFVGYTAEHIDSLLLQLEAERNRAFSLEESVLSEKCTTALGILLAMDNFIRGFHRDCGLAVDSLDKECPDAIEWLLELLEQTTDKGLDCGDLAAQFISMARSQLKSGYLRPCPVEHTNRPSGNVVFYNDEYLGFTAPAMSAVCRVLGQSRPVVLHALSEAGWLRGKTVNAGTFQTRINTWNAYGQHKIERVYLLARDLFDELGNPLIFDGEAL